MFHGSKCENVAIQEIQFEITGPALAKIQADCICANYEFGYLFGKEKSKVITKSSHEDEICVQPEIRDKICIYSSTPCHNFPDMLKSLMKLDESEADADKILPNNAHKAGDLVGIYILHSPFASSSNLSADEKFCYNRFRECLGKAGREFLVCFVNKRVDPDGVCQTTSFSLKFHATKEERHWGIRTLILYAVNVKIVTRNDRVDADAKSNDAILMDGAELLAQAFPEAEKKFCNFSGNPYEMYKSCNSTCVDMFKSVFDKLSSFRKYAQHDQTLGQKWADDAKREAVLKVLNKPFISAKKSFKLEQDDTFQLEFNGGSQEENNDRKETPKNKGIKRGRYTDS